MRRQTMFQELPWKDLVDDGSVIAGSPETVRQRMEDLIKSLHVGNIFCLMQVGDMPQTNACTPRGCSPKK